MSLHNTLNVENPCNHPEKVETTAPYLVSTGDPALSQRGALSAADWLRAVTDFRAPFGHDRLPTVWG